MQPELRPLKDRTRPVAAASARRMQREHQPASTLTDRRHRSAPSRKEVSRSNNTLHRFTARIYNGTYLAPVRQGLDHFFNGTEFPHVRAGVFEVNFQPHPTHSH